MQRSKIRQSSLAIAMLLASVALFSGSVMAAGDRGHVAKTGKPPGPTPTPVLQQQIDGGSIYYRGNDVLRAIAPDGAGDHEITGMPTGYTRPTRALHAGERWYLALRPSSNSWSPGFFPGGGDGGRLYELDLIRESDPGNPIALTDNGAACVQMWSDSKMYDWAADANGTMDGAVSWLGTRWADDDNDGTCDRVVDGGVFRTSLTIASDGTVQFVQPTAPEVTVSLSGSETLAEAFDWSPAGDAVSYVIHGGGQAGLWVHDASASSMIYSGWADMPAWSPDQDASTAGYQTHIAFHSVIGGASTGNYATYVISPDGTGLTEVARGQLAKSPKQHDVYNWLVQWSPSGSHLAYVELYYDAGSLASVWSLRTVRADGSDNRELLRPIGWLNGWVGGD